MRRGSSPRRQLRALAFGAAWVVLDLPSPALAFSSVEAFKLPAGGGGGGGRYFTGSPSDSYTCKACHEGGKGPRLDVLGLPLTAYRPGARYEFMLDWADDIDEFSAALEVTDGRGVRAGTIRLPPDDELADEEFCQPAEDGIPGARLSRVPPAEERRSAKFCGQASEPVPSECRQVIHVVECGSKRLRFLWTAPDVDVGPIWFAGSAVQSNADGDVTGDGVSDFGHVLGSPSAQNPHASTASVSCSAVSSQGSRVVWLWAWISGLALSARHWRRKATRARLRSGTGRGTFGC